MLPSLASILAAVHRLQLLVRADVYVLKYLLCVRQVSWLIVFLWMHFWFLGAVSEGPCLERCLLMFAHSKVIVLLLLNLRQWLTAWAWPCGTAFSRFPLYRSLCLLWIRFISFKTDWISHCHTANTNAWIHPCFSQSPRWESLCCAPFHFL